MSEFSVDNIGGQLSGLLIYLFFDAGPLAGMGMAYHAEGFFLINLKFLA